jgi:CubicO group peptidase (beta-lactamase class C family)
VSTNFVTNVVDDGKARSLPEEATLKTKAPTAPGVDPIRSNAASERNLRYCNVEAPLMTHILFLVAAFAVGVRPTAADPVDDFVRSFLERHRIPSAAISVVHQGRVVKQGGYGIANLELGVPATEESVYEIGSVTKQFTAEAVLMLVEEGRLGLEDRIETHLKNLPRAWSAITIRHLLTHTSGLKDWESGIDFSYRREYTPAEFVNLIAEFPLDFVPGDRFAYTNSAHPLLGMILEEVTGGSYESLVSERVFRRAGMTDTRFKHPFEVVPDRASGYVDHDGVFENGEPLRPAVIAANGGILSTAPDMARWLIALSKGELVKPETLELMSTPLRTNDGRPFNAGMGWFLDTFRGHRLLLHNGSTVAGYSSVVYRYPDEDLGVVVLMNVDRWNAVNVLATRVASFYVPGLSLGSLPERPDPDPELSSKLLAMLDDVAAGRGSEMLAPNLRSPRRESGFAGKAGRFAFLEREDLDPGGEERFGARIRWIYRYKLLAPPREIGYTFEVTPDGKVARFFPEEQ